MADPDAPVLAVLGSWEPTAPRLTWYGADGERVELSGRVLANWVIKAANLLSTECGTAPGDRVLLDLPSHWRLLVWGLAGLALDAEAVIGGTPPDPGAAAVVVSSRPQEWHGAAADLVAVPLPALARTWPDPLPPGVIDGAAELMGQPDLPVFPAPAGTAPAVKGSAHGGERLLLVGCTPPQLLEAAWSCWRDGGSVVVVGDGPTEPPDRIAEQEGARRP